MPNRGPPLELYETPNEGGTDLVTGQGYGEVNPLCGGFPNIPLMGTQGAINYNPELTLRQARYLMVLPPSEEAVTPFIIHNLWIQEGEHLRRIRHAWKNIVKKGSKWGLRSCGASSSYKSWLQHRTKYTFLTFSDPRFKVVAELQRLLWDPESVQPNKNFEPKEGTCPKGPGRDPTGRTADLATTKRRNTTYTMIVNRTGLARPHTN
ncbi:hypothetical protein CR513_37773, partial [Mucuna pruriens]